MKKTIKWGALTLLLFMQLAACKSNSEILSGYAEQPNVLYINVYDLGWKEAGYMGSTYYESPYIDKLSKEGMVYTQGYAAAANCPRSKACLMSGQNTPRHGVYTVSLSARGNSMTRKIIPPPNTVHLKNTTVTLAEMSKSSRYITGIFGKWHVTKSPLNYGFNGNIGGDQRGEPGGNGYTALYNNRPILVLAPEGGNLADTLTTEAITFIKENKNTPFFLYLPYYLVRTPLMGKRINGKINIGKRMAQMVRTIPFTLLWLKM